MKKVPAVLYVLTKLELGGAQKVCLALHEELLNHAYNSFLISGTEGALVKHAQKLAGCIFIDSFAREVSLGTFKREWQTFQSLVKTMRLLKKKHPDIIVHTHSTKAGILGRWAAFFAGISKRIHTVHGFGFHNYQNWLVWVSIVSCEWLTAIITTRFICVSKEDFNLGRKLLPRFSEKAILIRAAVDDHHFAAPMRKMTPTSNFTFGTISCFKPQKNLFSMLRIFKNTHTKALHLGTLTRLEIVGDGVQRKEIEAWIQTHNLQGVITLLGWQENVRSFLEQWDVFILSSLWEGLPCSIVEARLARLPIIAYDVGGIREIVHHEKNGFLVAPGDEKSFTQFMMKIALDKSLQISFGSYSDDLSDFSTRSMVSKHTDLYQSL